MKLKMIQTVLLTAFVLSGMLLVLNQSVAATETALLHPTETESYEPMILDGPDIIITLPGIPQERPNVERFLLVSIMLVTMCGFVGSILVSKHSSQFSMKRNN